MCLILNYLNKDEEALKGFESHCVIQSKSKCGYCGNKIFLKEERHVRYLRLLKPDPKSKITEVKR